MAFQSKLLVALGVGVLMAVQPCVAQSWVDVKVAAHSQGNIQVSVNNFGGFGGSFGFQKLETFIDPFTSDLIRGLEYPRTSGIVYPPCLMEIGGIVGNDTVYQAPTFFVSDEESYLGFDAQTFDISKSYYSPGAHSELDLVCVYTDTSTDLSSYPNLPPEYWRHNPLGLKFTQRSMAWSASNLDDFVIIYYEMLNIGDRPIKDMYVVFWGWSGGWQHINHFSRAGDSLRDDLVGFLLDYPAEEECEYSDTLYLAYAMDNDGDPVDGEFNTLSPLGAVGVSLLGTSEDSLRVNFNWSYWGVPEGSWGRWGPRRKQQFDDPYVLDGTMFPPPRTDAILYYNISRPEVDYDQLFTAIDYTSQGWMPPPMVVAPVIASGTDPNYCLSFGPFSMGVHEREYFAIAVVGGDNVHSNPQAVLDPNHPWSYYNQLDFSHLAENALWARKVYDVPGLDTDGDGFAGEFRVCQDDTIWTKGDGVPDFKGNMAPPAPMTRFIVERGKLIIRWNGFYSETTRDQVSSLCDFEGYHVYVGLDQRRASLSLLSSYDRCDFFYYHSVRNSAGRGEWVVQGPPVTLDSLRMIFDDPDLDPLRYNRIRPLFQEGEAYYFEPVDANICELTSPEGVHKVYPDAVDPGLDSTLWIDSDLTFDYERPLPKYYEYEYVVENLLTTIPYFVAVTAFDFGFTGGRSRIPTEESNPLNSLTEVYVQTSSEIVEERGLDVIVYPNPYIGDDRYYELGYENREGEIAPDRARLIHFSNLPRVCKISIFSLDGDLIGSIDHNYPEGGPESMHDWWNLVSRSGLAVQSGLFYWVVESEARTQIGKLVILK